MVTTLVEPKTRGANRLSAPHARSAAQSRRAGVAAGEAFFFLLRRDIAKSLKEAWSKRKMLQTRSANCQFASRPPLALWRTQHKLTVCATPAERSVDFEWQSLSRKVPTKRFCNSPVDTAEERTACLTFVSVFVSRFIVRSTRRISQNVVALSASQTVLQVFRDRMA